MSDLKEEGEEALEPPEPFVLGFAKYLDELVIEYGNYHVVTQWLEPGAEEIIADDLETRSPLLDLDIDDRYIRLETRGLPWKQIGGVDNRPPIRLSNLAIRLKRLALDNPALGIAFVQGFAGGNGARLWHVFPVRILSTRINDECKLVCILGFGYPVTDGLWGTIKTSLRRTLSGIRRSYFSGDGF